MACFDYDEYQLALAQSRIAVSLDELHLSWDRVVFDPTKHPRGLRGEWRSVGHARPQPVPDAAPKLTPIPPVSLVRSAMRNGATNHPTDSIWHGDRHWRAVAATGLELARRTPGSDPGFILTFAMLHDTMRLNEYEDPQHGERAAQMYKKLCRQSGTKPDPDLVYAFIGHNGTPDARDHPNPNVGICWDADRLNLYRVGQVPKDQYLTTEAAQTPDMKSVGHKLSSRQMNGQSLPSWSSLVLQAKTQRQAIAQGTAV